MPTPTFTPTLTPCLAAVIAPLLTAMPAWAQNQRGWAPAPPAATPQAATPPTNASRPTPAQSPAQSPRPATPAGETACDCEQIGALQQELRNAVTLRDRHAAMAAQLRQSFGDPPTGDALRQARDAYRAFETGAGPNAAGSGIAAVVPNAPPAISYIPRGQSLQEAHARDDRQGIPLAERWTADGRPEADLEQRRAIEAEWRAKGQDLCEFDNRAAIQRSATAGAACAGIARAVVAHEEGHRATCQRMGYYAFANRSPIGLADDEVRNYDAQINALAGELRRVAKLNKTRIISGSIGDTAQLLALRVRCALALNVVGQIDELSLKGKVCDTAETFTIPTVPNANMVLTPRDKFAGTYAYRGVVGGAGEFWGSGGYTIQLENGQGILTLDGAGRWWARNPVGTASKGGPERLKVSEIKEGC